MRYYLLAAYYAAGIVNADPISYSYSAANRKFAPTSLPQLPSGADRSLLNLIHPRSASLEHHDIYQTNLLSRRGIPSETGPSTRKSSTSNGNKSSSRNGKKQNGSTNSKQRKLVDPLPKQDLVAGSEHKKAAPLPLKTTPRTSAKLIADNSRDEKDPNKPDPKPPNREPSPKRSQTPPARAGIAVKGEAVAYTKSSARPARYFTGGVDTQNKKEIEHPRKVSAGGTMFRSIQPGHRRFDDSMVVNAMGKRVEIQITPHIGGLGYYHTDDGLVGSTYGQPPGVPMVISGTTYRPGQTTFMHAQLHGPGEIKAKADNQRTH